VFYDDWQGLIRVVVVGSAAYTALIVLLRVSGKRTLAKLNAFDFIVTVTLGSTLATVLLSSTVALAESSPTDRRWTAPQADSGRDAVFIARDPAASRSGPIFATT
jgi:hypothetical protein